MFALKSDEKCRDLDEAAALGRIERYIASPPENSRVFTITPQIARVILDRFNAHNRPTKPGKINEYAEAIEAGRWWLTGDTIKFSDKGLLRDGQNRLMACVRSGQAFRTHIVFGIDDGAFVAMDRGKNRDGSDLLAISGYNNTRKMAAAVRWAHLIENGRAKQRDTLNPEEILDLANRRYKKVLPDWVSVATKIYSTNGYPVGIVAGVLYNCSKVDQQLASEFGAALASGNLSGRFTPLRKMHEALAKIAAASSGRVHDVVRAAFLVIAWNACVERRSATVREFEWTPVNEFPVIKSA